LRGYILRIAKEEWVRQVFTLKKYYPGVSRRWEAVMTIFFAHKVEGGDAFLGYGVVEQFQPLEELSEGEQEECRRMGWRGAICFREVVKFEPPLLIRETPIGDLPAKGRYLHGYPLQPKEVESIMNIAKGLCTLMKVDC